MPQAPLPHPDDRSTRARLQRAGAALTAQPHLGAIRDGVVGALPLILLGSAFVLLIQPPWPGLVRYLPRPAALRAAYLACAGLVSIYACCTTALSLARRRDVDPAAAVTTALGTFLVAQHPLPLAAIADPVQALAMGSSGLPIRPLGAGGLFPAFAAAIVAVELIHFFHQRQWSIRLGEGAPEAVVRSFAALVPTVVCVVAVWAIVHLGGVDLAGGIGALFAPLVRGSDALPALLAIVLIDSCLYLIGVHPISVLSAVKPFWLAAIAENMAAVMAGQPAPHLATQEFFIWFVWQGGSGTTLALGLLLLRARSRQLKLVGRTGFVPAVFNINEPLLFGTPVVMNGKLAVPFVATPVVLACVTYAAMRAGLVRAPYIEVVWTLPAPVGAFLSTGGDWRAVGLQLVNLGVAVGIWWPFVRRYDRELLRGESAAAA